MTKTALITGIDSSDIAKAICSNLLECGYRVIVTSDGRYRLGTEARLTLEESCPGVSIEPSDFTSEGSVTQLINVLAQNEFDVIINCSAVLAMDECGSLINESAKFNYAQFNRVLQINVSAIAAICVGLIDRVRRGGTIINVTSSAAGEGGFATLSYNASKAAVENLTKSLANVFGPNRGVRVNNIAPGWIPPSADAAAGRIVALANALTPINGIGDPEHVVAAVHYLINSPFHNGSTLALDGGISSSYLPYMLEFLQLKGEVDDATIDTLVSLLAAAKGKVN